MAITFLFQGCKTTKIMNIQTFKEKEALSEFQVIRNTTNLHFRKLLSTGNNVRLNEFMLLSTIFTDVLFFEITSEVSILKFFIKFPLKKP